MSNIVNRIRNSLKTILWRRHARIEAENDIYKDEEKRRMKYKCRCGGELKLDFRDELTGGILIKDVPIMVCPKCGEEWYPPGIPRMIEGIREVVKRTGQVKIFENLKITGTKC